MKTFYRVDYTRVTFREYLFDISWLLLPVVALVKWLRIRSSGSTDEPAVETLAPFEVEEAALPEEIRQRFEPLTGELAALGFGRPIYHCIYHPLCCTYIYWATLLHGTGRAVARIHHRVWSKGAIHKSYLFPLFLSEMNDDTFLVSSAGKPDLLTPRSVRVVYRPGATATELWEVHDRRLDELLPCQPVTVNTPARVRDMIEKHHATVRDFHLARGVFRPVDETFQKHLEQQGEEALAAPAPTSVEEEVLTRLRQAPATRTSWGNFFLILFVSLLLFVAMGFQGRSTKFLWLLIPILFFHELGHYLTMRWFGYQNLRMFFIPLFGAAVAGKSHNVAGWKKAVVALMGPLPGIILGAGLGIAGLWWHQAKLLEIAILLLALNGFNLLPFLPLDGGWVLHAVLFCRHPLLDMAARLAAIAGVFGLAYLLGGHLWVVGVFLLLSLPASWQVVRAAHRLRHRELPAVSTADRSIPPETARVILAELGAGKHNRQTANTLAQQVTSVFETLSARPPGALASLGLLGIHGASFVGACVLILVFVLGQRGLLRARPPLVDLPLPHAYSVGATKQWRGPAAPAVAPPSVVLVASYSDPQAARAQFAALPAELPKQASLCWFGQHLLLTLPQGKAEETSRWTARLQEHAQQVSPVTKDSPVSVFFSCVLPSEEKAEQLRAELQDFWRFPQARLLIPPWSPAWQALPHADRLRFEKARHTLGRLYDLRLRALDGSGADQRLAGIRAGLRSGDQAAVRAAMAQLQKAREAEERRQMTQLMAADDATVDRTMLKLWEQQMDLMRELADLEKDPDPRSAKQKRQAWQRRLDALHEKMAQAMGPLSQPGGKPSTSSNIPIGFGYARRKQAALSLGIASFRQLDQDLPAFAEWLGQQGASQIRYKIAIHQPGEEEDED
ncbi:MAG TPA: site-2 protease family protein [Gemmataceae bacterium]|nr:site-2 protease family protein [Gemmataceae bacterium]